MIGASGAVGSVVAATLASLAQVDRLSLLGRRPVSGLTGRTVSQHIVDLEQPDSYRDLLVGHDAAICTVGVGEPSKATQDEFIRIDKQIPLEFASACKLADVRHFELLGSVGAAPDSRSFYLRSKGELEEALLAIGFERLSLFRPSMILTPTNRYGITQAITLALWPLLTPLLPGPLRKFRGVRVETLGRAIATNVLTTGTGREVIHWDEMVALTTP